MKTKLIKIASFAMAIVILSLICAVSFSAIAADENNAATIISSGAVGDNLTYTIAENEDTIIVNDVECTAYTLTISGTGAMNDFASYSATPWYAYRSYITELVLEEGITYIGVYAFNRLNAVSNLIIPDSVVEIGDYAFNTCTGFLTITIGSGVETIGVRSFYNDVNVLSITINATLKTVGDAAFNGLNSILKAVYNGENFDLIEFGSSNTDLTNAFTSSHICKDFNNDGYCDECYLTTTNIAYAVDGGYLYFDLSCGTLISADSTITAAIIPSTINGFEILEISEYAFYHCEELTSLVIPETIEIIGNSAFRSCTSLTSIKISGDVETINKFTFAYCSNLQYIIISGDVQEISYMVFASCTDLKSITLPNTITSIDETAFYNLKSLETIYFGGSEDDWTSLNAVIDETATVVFNHVCSDADGDGCCDECEFEIVIDDTQDDESTSNSSASSFESFIEMIKITIADLLSIIKNIFSFNLF